METNFHPTPESRRNPLDNLREAIDDVHTPEDVDNVVFMVLDDDPYAHSQMEKILFARNSGNNEREAELVRERQGMIKDLQLKIALETGVEIDAIEHERQREEYREKIAGIVSSIDPDSPKDTILEKLGIITPVEGRAGYRFSFPSTIFPPYVREQWSTYMEIVEQWDIALAKLEKHITTQVDFNGTDLTRNNAHNTVSHSIEEVLQFPGWELEDYRGFVAKMRDKSYAKSKGERERYGGAMRQMFDPENGDQIRLEFEKEDLTSINNAILDYRK